MTSSPSHLSSSSSSSSSSWVVRLLLSLNHNVSVLVWWLSPRDDDAGLSSTGLSNNRRHSLYSRYKRVLSIAPSLTCYVLCTDVTRASVKLFELGIRTPGVYLWAYGTSGVLIFGVFVYAKPSDFRRNFRPTRSVESPVAEPRRNAKANQ